MAPGSCNCGAVQFAIDGEVTEVILCHCSVCRRYSGAASVSVLVVSSDRFSGCAGDAMVSVWCKPGTAWSC